MHQPANTIDIRDVLLLYCIVVVAVFVIVVGGNSGGLANPGIRVDTKGFIPHLFLERQSSRSRI